MTIHSRDIDFAAIAADVVKALGLGEPNPHLSSPHELRFGSHGSLSVDLKKAVWHDHENGTGGGLLDLIARETGQANGAAFDWLRKNGFAPDRQPETEARPKIVATYSYRDEAGNLLFEVCRFSPKAFRQRQPDGRGGWSWSIKGVRRVLYRLPELLGAPESHLVLVVEGEKDADRLAGLGFVATTCAGGAGKWREDYAKGMAGRRAVILPDNDEAGRVHAETVLRSLRAAGVQAAVLQLDGLPPKGDPCDWLDAGGDPDELERRALGALAGAPEPEPPRSPWRNAAELDSRPIPPMQWLVEGLVPSGTVTMLGGDGGTGKSLLAMQLGVAVASGRPWIGRTATQGRALYLSAEDDESELHRRLATVAAAQGLRLVDLSRLDYRSLAGEDALLARLDGATGALAPSPLFAELEARIRQTGPSYVALDTQADLFPGNENDRALARQFIGMLRGLAIRHSCAVLLLSHPSLSGLSSGSGTSGSTAWSNSVRSRLYLERVLQDGYESDPDARRLAVKKANYARTGGEVVVRWQEGVFVADEPETTLDRMATSAKAERVFLRLLAEVTAQGRKVNHVGSHTYAPKVFASHPAAEGISQRAFKQAMELLLQRGAIQIAEDGPPSKRRQFLVAGAGS